MEKRDDCRTNFVYVCLLGYILFIIRAFSGAGDGFQAGLFFAGVPHLSFPDTTGEEIDLCSGKYIYVKELPARFNDEIIEKCDTLSWWDTRMCSSMSNMGLGPKMKKNSNDGDILEDDGWCITNQFVLEIIFRHRMKQYKCLTNDSSRASAIYVPFYAGFEVSRHLLGHNITTRDAAALDLTRLLSSSPEWKSPMWGRDHFFVAGRITQDFSRFYDNESDWGTKLMWLPETRNMTILAPEASPWRNLDFAIPYPTYFHPANSGQLQKWQKKLNQTRERHYLYSFVGAPRQNLPGSVRGNLIRQCLDSGKKCKLLDCKKTDCYNPIHVMKTFKNSVFCLQPSGDSYTRRSTFDSILAGCIPVFFNPGSAYVQYIWHLPRNYTKYSVFIPEYDVKHGNLSVEHELLRFSDEQVTAMRYEVIKMIPRIIYADPRGRLEANEDAFDVAIERVLNRVEEIRRNVVEEGNPNFGFDFPEDKSWKYNLFGNVEGHEWDSFFSQGYKENLKK